jgi:hypothetical protein
MPQGSVASHRLGTRDPAAMTAGKHFQKTSQCKQPYTNSKHPKIPFGKETEELSESSEKTD